MTTSPEAEPALSVIIPTHNRRVSVLATLDSLAVVVPADVAIEVIVVDDGSDDGSAEAVASWSGSSPVTVLTQPNRGAAATRNRGAARARADYLLFLDDDMRAAPGLIEAHLDARDAGADVVVGRLTLDPSSPDTLMSRNVDRWSHETTTRLGAAPRMLDPDDIVAGHLGVRRSVFEKIGGFAESFTQDGRYGNEDLDLGRRLIASGAAVWFVPEASTAQYYCVTADQHLRQMRDLGSSDLLLMVESTDAHDGLGVRQAKWMHQPASRVGGLLWRVPRTADRVVGPHRWLTCRRVDAGRQDARTRRWYRIHRGIAYRAGRAHAPADLRRRAGVEA